MWATRPIRRNPGGSEVSDGQRGLSPQQQHELGAQMAEVFAKAREAEELKRLKTERDCTEAN